MNANDIARAAFTLQEGYTSIFCLIDFPYYILVLLVVIASLLLAFRLVEQVARRLVAEVWGLYLILSRLEQCEKPKERETGKVPTSLLTSGKPYDAHPDQHDRNHQEVGRGDVAPQSNVSYTFLVRDCHYVAAGNNPTIEHVTKSDSLSASGESGSSLDNQGHNAHLCSVTSKKLQYLDQEWFKPAADHLLHMLTLCDKWVSYDFLSGLRFAGDDGNTHLTDTIAHFGNGIVDQCLIPLLQRRGTVKTHVNNGKMEVAIVDQNIRANVGGAPAALPPTRLQRDAAVTLHSLLFMSLTLQPSNTSLSVHVESVRHARYLLSLVHKIEGLLTPKCLIPLTLKMIEPVARFVGMTEADTYASYCLGLLLSFCLSQVCITPQIDPSLHRLHLVEANLLRARQQRRLGDPKTSVQFLDAAEKLFSDIPSYICDSDCLLSFQIVVTRAETLSYWGHYIEAQACLQSIVTSVDAVNVSHQCYYWTTRGGVCFYLSDYEQSEVCYQHAIKCAEEGNLDCYQKALIFVLAARVPTKFQPRDDSKDYAFAQLAIAEKQCIAARDLLSCHVGRHRILGVLDRTWAMIFTARAILSHSSEQGILLLQAIQYAFNALVCLMNEYGARNVNVAMTVQLAGDIAAHAVNVLEHDKHRQSVMLKVKQMYGYFSSATNQSDPQCESLQDISQCFYRQAFSVYEQCYSSHPACATIMSVLK